MPKVEHISLESRIEAIEEDIKQIAEALEWLACAVRRLRELTRDR